MSQHKDTCPVCKGSGKQPGGSTHCALCDGVGIVPVQIEEPGDETTAPETPTSDELFEQLDTLVSRYFKELWEESGQGESGDYISSWAVVAHFANMNDPIDRPSAGYICETSPTSMPPHSMKGLFSEGIDWVDEAQHMDEDE